MYIPITTMQEYFPLKGDNIPQDALNSIQYNPTIKNDNTAADIAVHRVIAQRHGFDPSLADAFNEFDTITESHIIGVIFTAMDVFLGSVGVVTLALGAVGIINIMLVSVSERTREIGVMKAVGATKRSIIAQFFWEGLLLTGISGLIGIGVSWAFMASCRPCSLTKFPVSIRRASCPGPPRWLLFHSPSAASLPASTLPAKPRPLTPSKPCAGSEKCSN
jgi:putative ABC transport system permease protein